MERPNRKPIPLPHVGDCARKNQSSSPSTTAELIPATPQAERAIANVLRRTAIRALNPEPDQASASHAGAESPKPSATPTSIGRIEKMLRVWTSDLIDNHAMRSSSIKTV